MATPDPELIELFVDVAAIEGRSGRERSVADRILAFLRELGLDPVEGDRDEVGGGDAGNVVCAVRGGGDRVLLAHMDTARSTGAARLSVRDDRVVSDGTTVAGVDNRAGVAALLHATREAVGGGAGGPGFTLAFTVCEETTLAGSRSLTLPASVRMGFVFDSALRPGHVVVRSPGARRFRGLVRGRAAHSGIAPENGVDALRVAAAAIAAMPLGRIDDRTTANVGTLEAGSAINVVPDRATFEGEVRSTDEGAVDRVLGEIRRHLERACAGAGATLTLDDDWDFRPYAIDEDDPVRRRAIAAIAAAGLDPVATGSAGGSDANSLNARGVPAVNLGIGAQNPHGDDEFILLEDLAAAAAIARDLMTRV